MAGSSGDDGGPPGPPIDGELRKPDWDPRGVALRECIGWVAEHLDAEDVEASDAPSAWSWTMYLWAREDRTGFMQLWAKVFASSSEAKKQVTDDGRKLFDLLAKLEALASTEVLRA